MAAEFIAEAEAWHRWCGDCFQMWRFLLWGASGIDPDGVMDKKENDRA